MNPSHGDQKLCSFLTSIRALAFDLDGTLFSREEPFARLIGSWLTLSTRSVPQNEIVSRDEGGMSPRLPFFAWLNAELQLEESGEALWQRFRHELPQFITPQPESAIELRKLREAGFALAVLSNGSKELQINKLHATELYRCFDPEAILVSGAIGVEKPAREAFLALENALSIPSEEILFVGDHWENDVLGARAAGMNSCWLAHRRTPRTKDSRIFVIDELVDLFAILSRARTE